MSKVLDGFVKAAWLPEAIGAGLGGLAGYALSRGGNLGQRMSAVAMGMGAGGALGVGIDGIADEPDFRGLTAGEIAVLQEEAEEADTWRNAMRAGAIGAGLAGAVAYRSPLPLLTALPAATITPIGEEASRQRRMANRFRAARRSS
jgi:hypothetical protein